MLYDVESESAIYIVGRTFVQCTFIYTYRYIYVRHIYTMFSLNVKNVLCLMLLILNVVSKYMEYYMYIQHAVYSIQYTVYAMCVQVSDTHCMTLTCKEPCANSQGPSCFFKVCSFGEGGRWQVGAVGGMGAHRVVG